MAEAIVAQLALETGSGAHVANNNFGGIKADSSWSGKSATLMTKEQDGEDLVSVRQKFRAYDSVEDGIRDYVRFITSNPRYAKALKARSASEYFTALQAAGYATDAKYASKLLAVFDRIYPS